MSTLFFKYYNNSKNFIKIYILFYFSEKENDLDQKPHPHELIKGGSPLFFQTAAHQKKRINTFWLSKHHPMYEGKKIEKKSTLNGRLFFSNINPSQA
ncbi:hypothetical protein BsIDN1_05860 [Bacillus safensis]|uniref:Uncharacterized protein n=1 Tax=Bacillus safensis TaxID=561879 RepID=A0A5S9M2P7_BACIA|nr:hypothetical protein BsIDN1_05860 [Bacillus safensis]